MDSDFAEFQDNIALLIQPVREFRWLGCSCPYSFLTPQSFFLKKVKRSFHFFQTFNRKISSFFGFIDFITPILAFIFIKQIIVIFSGSFIKFPFILKCLCFTALITAQFITLAFCQKIFSTDFALTETKASHSADSSNK